MAPKIIDYRKLYRSWVADLIQLGDFEEALFLAKRLVELYPGHADAYSYLANIFLKTGDIVNARAGAERAVLLDPSHQDGSVILARVLQAQNEHQTLADLIETKLAEFPIWHELRRFYADLLLEEKRFDEAVIQWQHVVQATLAYEDRTMLALAVALQGRREDAFELVGQLLSENDLTCRGLTILGKALFEIGELRPCAQLLQDTLKLNGADEEVMLSWSKIFERSGQPKNALTLLEAGLPCAKTPRLRRAIEEIHNTARIPRPARYQWKQSDSRRIVFVSETPKIREAKLAYGLRQIGWEVILVHRNNFNGESSKYFDASYRYQSAEEALNLVGGLGCKLFHVFTAAVCPTSMAFVTERPGVVILDYIDFFDAMIYHNYELMAAQRHCFERADALVCRDIQIAESNRLNRRRRIKDSCYFPEYCWPRLPDLAPRQHSEDEIHLVHGGWVDAKKPEVKTEQTNLDILTQFAERGVHVHLYAHMNIPREHFAQEYGDFLDLGKRTGRAHFHETLPFDQLPAALAQYDFGLCLIPRLELPGHSTRYPKSKAHYQFCGSARITDYIDACLPVISDPLLRFQGYTLKRHGLRIPFSPELLRDPLSMLKPYCNQSVRQQILERRRNYTIAAHSPRLSAFYARLQKKHGII